MSAIQLHEIEIDPRIEVERDGVRVKWSSDFQCFLDVRLTPEEMQLLAECFLGQLLRGFFAAAVRADNRVTRRAVFDGVPRRYVPTPRIHG